MPNDQQPTENQKITKVPRGRSAAGTPATQAPSATISARWKPVINLGADATVDCRLAVVEHSVRIRIRTWLLPSLAAIGNSIQIAINQETKFNLASIDHPTGIAVKRTIDIDFATIRKTVGVAVD